MHSQLFNRENKNKDKKIRRQLHILEKKQKNKLKSQLNKKESKIRNKNKFKDLENSKKKHQIDKHNLML